jgi:hypothetical protein
LEVAFGVVDLGALLGGSGTIGEVLLHLLDTRAAILYFPPSGAVGEECEAGADIVYHSFFDGIIEFADLARFAVAFRSVATGEISNCVRGTTDVLD